MKKIFLPLLTVLALGLGITACDKEPVEQQPHQSVTVTHDANAFEYVGVQHNQGLDYYLANADFRNPEPDIEPLSVQFCVSLGYNQADIEKDLKDPQISGILNAADPAEALRDYYRANSQRAELAYVDQIDAAITQSATATDVVARLERIEQTVQTDKALPTSSREALLRGLAVGKHSAVYWYDQAQQGPRSPWVTNSGGTTTGGPAAARINWWKVVWADVVGAISGGLWGAVIGSVKSIISQL